MEAAPEVILPELSPHSLAAQRELQSCISEAATGSVEADILFRRLWRKLRGATHTGAPGG